MFRRFIVRIRRQSDGPRREGTVTHGIRRFEEKAPSFGEGMNLTPYSTAVAEIKAEYSSRRVHFHSAWIGVKYLP